MNDATRERLADAVLDSLDQGTPLDPTITGGDRQAEAELRACADAAALATLALCTGHGRMPEALALRLGDVGRAMAAQRRRASSAPRAVSADSRADGDVVVSPRPAVARGRAWFLFAFGAAAGIALSFAWPFAGTRATAPGRDELLARAGTAHIDWQPGPSHDFGEVRGDVVWRGDTQQGYLRIDGLRELPPDRQYQLWIVDGTRQGPPVDGGLFDLHGAGEHVVPIQARLPVAEAKAFVVTVEPRGGVVVSGQEHVVAVASL